VQSDDGAPHMLAPFTVATVGLKPRRSLTTTATDEHRRRVQRANLAALGGKRNTIADDLRGERGGWRVGSGRKLAELQSYGVG
jgi:hypothetical protein